MFHKLSSNEQTYNICQDFKVLLGIRKGPAKAEILAPTENDDDVYLSVASFGLKLLPAEFKED